MKRSKGGGLCPRLFYDRGISHYRRTGRNVFEDDRIGSDFHVVSDGYRSEDFRSRADERVFSDGRVAFFGIFPRSSKGHFVKKHESVAEFGRFSNDDRHAVVDEPAIPEFGSRMDVDSRDDARHHVDHASHETEVFQVERMGQVLMEHYRVESGIEIRLESSGSGIFFEDGLDFGFHIRVG